MVFPFFLPKLLLLNLRNAFVEPERFEYFRRCLFNRKRLMAGIAILSDRPAISGRMVAVVTAETSRKVRVTQIVRIRAPGDLQIRKNIAVIDGKNRLPSFAYVLGT